MYIQSRKTFGSSKLFNGLGRTIDKAQVSGALSKTDKGILNVISNAWNHIGRES